MVVVLALVACLGFCIYKKCFNKGKKPKKARERKAGRGRRKKDNEGEEGEEKKVSKDKLELVFPFHFRELSDVDNTHFIMISFTFFSS